MSEVQDFIDRHWENIASEIEFQDIAVESRTLSQRSYMIIYPERNINQVNERRWRRLPNSQRIRGI